MANDNSVTLVGNVTREPELRFTPSGQAIATFGLAVNRVWNDRQSNERKESVSFFNVVAWAQLGENVSESLPKGTRVMVTGRLEQRSYEDKQGEKKSVVEVIADEVGPSLRWATAEISRNERRGAEAMNGAGPRSSGEVRQPGGSGSSFGGSGSAPYDDGEEPF